MDISELANYCLSCPVPRCQTGCPTGNHIRDFIKAMKTNDLDLAAKTLYEQNPYPELTSRLCDCARQCQGHCVRGIKGEPVQIQQIERFISDNSQRPWTIAEKTGKSAGIVGSGPAALAAARDLIQVGWTVDIYEKQDQAGGAIYTGIPAYRFDHSYVTNIVQELCNHGVVFHYHTTVGKDITLPELQEKHDAVLLAIGAEVENTYGLSGIGCEAGLSLLYHLNVEHKQEEYAKKYHGAVVWGGGNVAMDCARSLRRILPEVTVIYRRSRKEMPANAEEIDEAIQEGVTFGFLENIKELRLDEDGKVVGAHCIKMHLGEPDESGRRRPIETEGSDYEIKCELVVPAIGQKVDLTAVEPSLVKGETHRSNLKKVYVCGDAYLGPKTVAAAIHDGREAAKEILGE